MTFVLAIIFFSFGLVIGSFLNVVIFRFGTGRTFGGRSHCMSCGKELLWHELVPLFSFLVLWGRCSGCRSRISIQYPVVELLSGAVFAGLFLKLQNVFYADAVGFALSYAYHASFFSVLLVVSAHDLRHKVIPDIFSAILAILSFAGLFLFSSGFLRPHFPSPADFLPGLLLALFFILIWFLSRGRWMGFGDGKLALSLGWFLGPARVLSGAVLSFWIGAVSGIALVFFSKKYGMKSEIPFAPFLAAGAALAFFLELQVFPFGV